MSVYCAFVMSSETVLFGIQFLLLALITFGKSPSLPCQFNASLRHTLTTYVSICRSLTCTSKTFHGADVFCQFDVFGFWRVEWL